MPAEPEPISDEEAEATADMLESDDVELGEEIPREEWRPPIGRG